MLSRVASAIRNKLRKWLRIVDPPAPPATLEGDAKHKGISIAAALLARAGEKLVGRKFAAPVLPPGVVPTSYTYNAADDPGQLGPYLALDSEFIAPSYYYANSFNTGLGFPGYAYLAELSQRSEYRAASETIASEMTREWIKFTVKGKGKKKDKEDETDNADPAALGEDKTIPIEPTPPTDEADETDEEGIDEGLEDKLEEIEEDFEKFKVRDAFRMCAQLDGMFGRAQLFIDIDPKSRNADEVRQLPLCIAPETIKKDSLRAFKVIEPIWTTPYTYNATDPMAQDFYVPKAWYIMGKRVHNSRLLTFIMREVPDMLKPAYNFSGLSMTQLMEPYVYQWLRTRNSISDLIHNFSVMVLKTDMAKVLGGDVVAGTSLLDRIKLFIANRDNQGLTVLDKTEEEMEAITVPLGGLHELQAQSQEHMAAPSHIPLVKLLGITPGGLNASSEGEIKVFYDFVRSCQEQFFRPNLKTVLQIIQLNRYGSIDDSIGFEFVTLSAPTVKELAEIRKSNAETDATYIDKGVISPEEVRERVGSDPDSGYNNLSGEAPEPPDLGIMGTEQQLGEKTAEAAHGRSEESAEAAHERQLEADKNAAKTKAA